MGGIYGSESEDSGYEMERRYTFEGEKSARGMARHFGMVFGSGAGGKKRSKLKSAFFKLKGLGN